MGRGEEVGALKPHVPLSEMLLVMGLYVLLLCAGCAWMAFDGPHVSKKKKQNDLIGSMHSKSQCNNTATLSLCP